MNSCSPIRVDARFCGNDDRLNRYFEEIPEDVKNGMEFHFVEKISQVIKKALA